MVQRIKLKGKVVKGIGKGSYFLSLDPYKKFFRGLLGNDPYPGTLNIELEKDWDELFNFSNIFQPAGLGGIYYSLGVLNGIKVVIIRPHKSKHPSNIIEIVSDRYLREEINVVNGKIIEFEVFVQ